MARAIEVSGVGKRYTLGEDFARYPTLRETLESRLRRRSRPNPSKDLWALRDVGFSLDDGEILGIVGRNGAGKTTLLRILTRITEPTEGSARTRGRVGALLDVGTGFHPELTGRENVFLNGTILGMSTKEIDRRFDEIVTFADVERFVDTPLKRYSAGMELRLAFSVAAHLEPAIVVVDEVLAVGDVAFQQKCLGKMGEVAGEGRTVLFVSHSMGAIESLCERVIWLDRGRLMSDGAPREVIANYLSSALDLTTERSWTDAGSPAETVRMRSARVFPVGGGPSDPITVRTPFSIEFEYENLAPGSHLNLSLHLYAADGTLVLNAVPVNERNWFGRPYPAGTYRDRCDIPGDLLNDGTYRIELLVVRDQRTVLVRDRNVLELTVEDVVDGSGTYGGEWPGVVRPSLDWHTERLD